MSDFEVIPQAAIDHLIANPTTGEQFDGVFGKGRAAEVLANQNPVPDAEVKDEDLSFLETAWDVTGRAVGYGVQEAGNETVDAVESFDIWASQHLDKLGVPSRLQLFETNEDGTTGAFNPQLKFYHESLGDRDFLGGTVGEKGDAVQVGLVAQPKTLTGGIVGGISQFAAGFVGAGKFTKLTGLRGAFVNGAIADALVFDPKDPNVTKMLESFDIDTGAFGEIMGTDPDDPEYINRLRNVAEGALAGGIVEAIGWGVKAARAAKAGDDAAAAKFTEAQEGALRELDQAIAAEGKAMIDDAKTTLDMSKDIFDEIEVKAPDADGQLKLDLGDTPQPKSVADEALQPEPAAKIFLTPEKTEKIRLQTALAAGAPRSVKQAPTSFRSLTTVTDFEDVLDDIAGTQAVFADEFSKIKGGDVQRWATVKAQATAKLRQMAEMTGEDPKALVRKFMSADMGDITQIAAEVHARSRYILTVEKELKEMAQVITEGVNGKPYSLDKFPGIKDLDHLRIAFQQRREVAANLLAGQDALRTNVARAMNAMKIAVKSDDKLQAMLKDPSVFRDVDAAAKAVADPANAGNPAVKVIDETLKKLHGFMDDVNTFRINALLSGPGTHEVNLISNVVNSFVIPAEQALGGMAKGDYRMMVHATKQLQGTTTGLFDAVATALRAGWWNDAVLDPASLKIEDAAVTQGGKTLAGKVVRLPSRALMTMDEFFKQSQYRGRVFADANELAAQKGLKGDEKTAFIKQYLKESYTDTGAAVRGDALLQARRATFTEPLEPGLASMLQAAAIKSPAIRFFVPFIRTPVNILSQTYQHAPLIGATSKRFRADLEAGGARAAQARGRQVVGTGLVAMAGWAAATGQITGSGPTDPRIRKVWLKNNQPYAFKVTNEDGSITWISYARLEPLSNVFSIAADAVEIMNDEYNEAERYNVIQSLTMAVMENTVNKTFTQGIYDAMSLFVGRPHEQERALRNFVSSFVPNVANQTNGDDLLREARSVTDAIMAKSHLYNQVDPKRNVLGEPIVRTLPKYDPLGLTHKDRREQDPVLAEVTRMAILNQSVADNPGKTVDGPNKIDLTTVPYKEGQSLYDRWVELTSEVKIGGKTLREKLAETFESRSYRVAPEGRLGAVNGTKGAIIRKIIVAYREKAKGELPELLEIIKAEKRGDGQLLRSQAQRNRELFPATKQPQQAPRRRTFDDLLGR